MVETECTARTPQVRSSCLHFQQHQTHSSFHAFSWPCVADENTVAVALQKLAKRQAARQYSAHNKTSGQNWDELFSKMDFTQDQSHDDLRKNMEPGTLHSYHASSKAKAPNRHLSADSTFETFINHDFRSSADGAASVWQEVTAGRSSTGSSEWRNVHKEAVKEAVEEEKRPVAHRENYNRQMRIINQKLAEEKVKLQQHLQRHPYVPRPPQGPKRPISGRRITR